MNEALLWFLHLAFAIAAFAAAVAMPSRDSVARRRLSLIAGVVPSALVGYLAWRALELRFGAGVVHAPWGYALSLLAACAAGLAIAWRRRATVRERSAAGLGGIALAALALEGVVLSNMQAAVRHQMGDLRVEAGLLAYAALPAKPAAEDNAAPLIEEAIERLRGAAPEDDATVGWRKWKAVLDDGEEVDLDSEELAAFLRAVEPALELVRAAATRTRFRPDGESVEGLILSDMIGLFDLGRTLELRARADLVRGDVDAAEADLDALMRLADHQLDTPTWIGVMIASSLRSLAIDVLVREWDAGRIDARTAGELCARRPSATAAFGVALRLEEAYGLGMLGRAADVRWQDRLPDFGEPAAWLGLLLTFDAEVAEYRDALRRLRAAVEGPEDLRALEELDEAHAGGGVAVRLLIPRATDALDALRASDARLALARIAFAAAEVWEAEGTWPSSLDDVADLSDELRGVATLEPAANGGLRVAHGTVRAAAASTGEPDGVPLALELARR